MKKVAQISAMQHNILECLATYKFLTVSQLIRLGVSKNKDSLRRRLKDLSAKGLIDKLSFAVSPTHGKLQNVFYLLETSKNYLLSETQLPQSEILIPKGIVQYGDYFHRCQTIDVEISIRTWLEQQGIKPLFFYRYFDKVGANRGNGQQSLRAKTKVNFDGGKYLIADGLFGIKTADQSTRPFCVELYRDKNTKRVLEQLEQYGLMLARGYLSDQLQTKKSAKILCIFEHQSTMVATIKRLQTQVAFNPISKFLFFAELKQIIETPLNGWANTLHSHIPFDQIIM